ncbi:hypothetical protein J0910_17420 [Nocardiopsis sp. CNT-189]
MHRLLVAFALSAAALLALGAAPPPSDDSPHDTVCKVGLLPPLFCAGD